MGSALRHVALWRGINVGRAKRLAMADLRAVLESLGFSDVQTLLNSGNAVFTAPKEAPEKIAKRIRAAVLQSCAVDAPVIVKTAEEISAALEGNPLGAVASDPSRLLVAFSSDCATLRRLEALQAAEGERLHVGKAAAYLWCGNGILESKLAVKLLKDLGETGTTRNWATLEKIALRL